MNFENNYLTFIFERFYNKQVDLNNLIFLRPVFEYNFTKLNDPIIAQIKKGDDFSDFFIKKSENIGRFSACKTFQQAKDLTDLVISTDGFMPFEDFATFANEILEKYNVAHLETEYNDVISNSQSSRAFLEAEVSGVAYLEYSAINDGLTREDHSAMDGIILPINNPMITPNRNASNNFNIVIVFLFLVLLLASSVFFHLDNEHPLIHYFYIVQV